MAQRSTRRKKTALCRRVPRGQEAVIQGNNFLSIQPLERTEGPFEGLNSIWQQSDGLRTLALGQRAPEAQVCHDDTDHKTGRDAGARRAEEARRDEGTDGRATGASVRKDMLTSTSTSTSTHEQHRVTVSS